MAWPYGLADSMMLETSVVIKDTLKALPNICRRIAAQTPKVLEQGPAVYSTELLAVHAATIPWRSHVTTYPEMLLRQA